ncbi:D-alanyl-D-alanine carboxypeptidase [Periweissella cryptocerci]|uniref:serine-type D-Ala-D-Ala carboxypeptidase n=1 Tax=Periweissella cryptocerci TaxID=2506420 RepID=A0A4P6YUK5_9LACO|nr:D-alanyl-D-alanine carboxypeptidase family protein [Periweissella cryptocerci]QBO36411.1 D-alanyl-D-alanine carboxypeptidase [Periweissella cryptocerci]
MISRIKWGLTVVIASISLLTLIPANANAAVINPHVQAKGAIVVDAKSGQVLSEQNPDTLLPAASTSKLLTVYLVHQAIQNGKLSWNTRVKITPNIAKVSIEPELTNVPLTAGRSYTVSALYRAALLDSANAAAMALGQAVSGSQADFVELMQKQLNEWGIKTAQIYGAAGLKNNQVYSDAVGGNRQSENMLSVADMAIIARHLVNEYPTVLNTTQLQTARFGKTTLTNTNWLLPGGKVKTQYKFDGLKTGASTKAHGNFVGSLTYAKRRLVTVIFGAGSVNAATDPARFIQTNQLLAATLPKLAYTEQGAMLPQREVDVKTAKERKVTLVVKEPIGLWLPKKHAKIQTTAHQTQQFNAPFNAEKRVGTVDIKNDVSYLPGVKRPQYSLVTGYAEKRVGFFELLWRDIQAIF